LDFNNNKVSFRISIDQTEMAFKAIFCIMVYNSFFIEI